MKHTNTIICKPLINLWRNTLYFVKDNGRSLGGVCNNNFTEQGIGSGVKKRNLRAVWLNKYNTKTRRCLSDVDIIELSLCC